MSKKKNRPPTAQNLIDTLLDEKTPAKAPVAAPKSSAASDVTASVVLDFQERSGLSKARQVAAEVDDRADGDGTRGTDPDSAASLNGINNASAAAATHDDRTVRIQKAAEKAAPRQDEPKKPTAVETNATYAEVSHSIDRMMPTEIKTALGGSQHSKQKVAAPNYSAHQGSAYSSAFSSAEASLKQSESLRVAQKRITDLEQELERLRRENENLSTAGDTLRRRSDELLTRSEQLEAHGREAEKTHEEEKKVYRSQLQQKDRDAVELRGRLEEMEGRLENNFKKIRVRERELEHRLEIIKMESATLVSTKDKMILDLKRQIDQLAHENEYGKNKTAELFNQFKGKQETIRRVVRALRIALTILEGDEDAASGASKKSE